MMSSDTESRNRSSWVLLTGLALVIAFAFQGSRGLWAPDEGRYAECAREMLVSGDYLTPRLSGSLHFTKPPLTYWAIAGGLRVLGINEWGARFYLAISFVLTTLAVAALGTRMWNRATGIAAGIIYVTMPMTVMSANIATTDTLVALWETLLVLCFWYAFSSVEGRGKRGWIALMWAASGAAFLTKGPVALLPLIPILIFLLTRRSPGRSPAEFITPLGIGLFALIGLGWYVWVVIRHEGLFSFFLESELLGRITGKHGRNSRWYHPFTVYGLPLLVGSLPWTLVWLPWWKRWRRRDSEREREENRSRSPASVFLVLWFLVPLAVLSLARSRLPLYVLPLFAPLALLTARALVRYSSTPIQLALLRPNRLTVSLGIWVMVLLAAKFAASRIPNKLDERALWSRIHREIEGNPGPIVGANVNRHGLTFYSDGQIEMLNRIRTMPLPLGADEILAHERMLEVVLSGRPHGHLVWKPRVESLKELLTAAGFRVRIVDLGDRFILVVCTVGQSGTT